MGRVFGEGLLEEVTFKKKDKGAVGRELGKQE